MPRVVRRRPVRIRGSGENDWTLEDIALGGTYLRPMGVLPGPANLDFESAAGGT